MEAEARQNSDISVDFVYLIMKIFYYWNKICMTALFTSFSLAKSKTNYFQGFVNYRLINSVSWFCDSPHYVVILLLIDWYSAFCIIKMLSDKSIFKVVYNLQVRRSVECSIFIWWKSWAKLMFMFLGGAGFLETHLKWCMRPDLC